MAAPQHGQANIAALPSHLISDTGITSHIASRYHAHFPVSNLSSHGVVSLNTYTSSTRGPNGGKDGSGMGAMEEMANRIWTRLSNRQENQAVIFLYVHPPARVPAGKMLTASQWRVRLRQDHSEIAPAILTASVLLHTSVQKALLCRLRLRLTHNYKIRHHSDGLKGWSLL